MDTPIASALSYEVFEQRRSESKLSAPAFNQSYQGRKTTRITGTRHDELIARLGGRAPLVHEQGDGGSHGV